MAKKLTLAALVNGTPGHYPDAAVDGLRYRVHGPGRVYAQLRYKDGTGRWCEHSLGRLHVQDRLAELAAVPADKELAYLRSMLPRPALDALLEPTREAAKALRQELRQGNLPNGGNTLGKAVDAYLKHVRATKNLRPGYARELERYLFRVWTPLHHRPIAQITRGEVQAQLNEMAADAGGVTSNRARMALSGLFKWAFGLDMVTANVVAGTTTVAEKPKERVLSLTELRQLWAVTDEPGLPENYRLILKLLLLLGQRREEVGGMKWEEIDLDRALWSLPASRTKNGKPHVVPLPEAAVALLRGLERRGEHVFGDGQGYCNWSQSKSRLNKLLSLSPFVIHDIRRSVVSGMNEIGIEPHIVEAAINHISGFRAGVAGTYNKALYLPQRTEAFRRWAEHLLGAAPAQVIQLRA